MNVLRLPSQLLVVVALPMFVYTPPVFAPAPSPTQSLTQVVSLSASSAPSRARSSSNLTSANVNKNNSGSQDEGSPAYVPESVVAIPTRAEAKEASTSSCAGGLGGFLSCISCQSGGGSDDKFQGLSIEELKKVIAEKEAEKKQAEDSVKKLRDELSKGWEKLKLEEPVKAAEEEFKKAKAEVRRRETERGTSGWADEKKVEELEEAKDTTERGKLTTEYQEARLKAIDLTNKAKKAQKEAAKANWQGYTRGMLNGPLNNCHNNIQCKASVEIKPTRPRILADTRTYIAYSNAAGRNISV